MCVVVDVEFGNWYVQSGMNSRAHLTNGGVFTLYSYDELHEPISQYPPTTPHLGIS